MKQRSVILAFLLLVSLSGCSEKNETVLSETEVSEISHIESTVSKESSSLTVNVSSQAMPLEKDTWGTAAKYDPVSDTYINVPVKITNIIHGTEAEQLVRHFTAQNSAYTDTELPKGCEWTVAEYEISLDNYPVPEGGVTPYISSSVMSSDGESFLLDGKNWHTFTVNISEEEYFFEGTIKGEIAYMMLQDNLEYIIVLGENDEQQAFFKAV